MTTVTERARGAHRVLHILAPDEAMQLARAQFLSRHLDLEARRLRRSDQGYYTIGSAGHEGNVAIAAATRVSDPAFLHYRSGALFLHRAQQAGYPYAVRDVLLGMCAARSEPIAGGRHKVWGSAALAIPPQTSTISSHLPKAVGMALAIEKRRRLGLVHTIGGALPDDAIVVCSFGDASLNQSTAQGALNSAAYAVHQGHEVPLVFVCEDNGLGISVPTAPGWVEAFARARSELAYVAANGLDLEDAVRGARDATDIARRTRRPVFLHLRTARLLGHAGSDVELSYRSEAAIRATEAEDPLLATAALLVDAGVASASDVLAAYEDARTVVAAASREALAAEPLRDADDVMSTIARVSASREASAAPPIGEPLALAARINGVLGELLGEVPELLVFGQDIGKKGGIYGVTRRLQSSFSGERVFDTHLDETFILGLAIGAGHAGFVSVPEIQYLAFFHTAADQLRGEAATLSFFSSGQFANPFVLRLPSYGYQKGFGGHFHNDNSIAALLDIPGVIVASPARGDDAAAMLRTCVTIARASQRVCVFLEPIALYTTADLYASGDGEWLTRAVPGATAELGRARLWLEAENALLLVTFANGVPMCLRTARKLAARGIACSVLDLRWLAPLPREDLLAAASRARAVLVVDETRATGGVSQHVIAALVDGGVSKPIARVTSKDSFIPLGPAAAHVLLSEAEIEAAALALHAREAHVSNHS